MSVLRVSFNSSLKDTGGGAAAPAAGGAYFQFLIKGYRRGKARLPLLPLIFQFLIKGYQNSFIRDYYRFYLAFNSSLKDTLDGNWENAKEHPDLSIPH